MMKLSTRLARPVRSFCTAASDRVAVNRGSDGVVTVTLSRPEKLNALDLPMFRAIQQAARDLIADSTGVRAVVLSGDGRGFCAGLDVKNVMHPLKAKQNMETLLERPEGERSNLAQDVGYLWRRVPVPVIAAVHGVCLGGGLQIALGADMRIAHPSTKMSIMEAKWGVRARPRSTIDHSARARAAAICSCVDGSRSGLPPRSLSVGS